LNVRQESPSLAGGRKQAVGKRHSKEGRPSNRRPLGEEGKTGIGRGDLLWKKKTAERYSSRHPDCFLRAGRGMVHGKKEGF